MAVPTPIFEIDEDLPAALSIYNYYDEEPDEYASAYVELDEIVVVDVDQETVGLWTIDVEIRFNVVRIPHMGDSTKKVTALARDVVDTLDAYTWTLTGFAVNQCWGSGLARRRFIGEDGEEMHVVPLVYTLKVDLLV